MSSDSVIQVQNVSKHYLMYDRPEDRLKQMVIPRLRRLIGRPSGQYFTDFSAIEDISIDVRKGETVGIIGRNGSGKSTLLQMVCGTIHPTSGSVKVSGRIAALLELGAGFSPEFTGRENIFLNAAILGLSRKEAEDRFDDIVRFADIGPFLDRPVKIYSSGMYVRLAFAVAINIDPDILVVDEALSVGDEAFQRKCFARIEQIRENGATILFVSHGAQTIVQLCDRAILIDRGQKLLDGSPKLVMNQYQRFMNLSGPAAETVRNEIMAMDGGASDVSPVHPNAEAETPSASEQAAAHMDIREEDDPSGFDPDLVPDSVVAYEEQGANIHNVHITTIDGRRVNLLDSGRTYLVRYRVKFTKDVSSVIFGMRIKTLTGVMLAGANNEHVDTLNRPTAKQGDVFDVSFKFVCRFLPGTYAMDVGVKGLDEFAHRHLEALMFRVLPKTGSYSVGHFDLGAELSYSTEASPVDEARASKPLLEASPE